MVIWFIGISGAGKSMMGEKLRAYWAEEGRRAGWIDGDQAREFFDHDLGYSRTDREANIKRIIYGAYLLSSNGLPVIVCNISPFQSLRKLARAKIPGYTEIHLKKGIGRAVEADSKGVYRGHLGQGEVVGVDIPFEEPEGSDFTVDMDDCSGEEAFENVLEFLRRKQGDYFK